MPKPILMIHHVQDWMFDLPLANFVLTFDDGYRDHWDTFQQFLAIATPKIYCVTGAWIGQPNFLSVDEIKHMMQYPDVQIAAHGFDHWRWVALGRGDVYEHTLEHMMSVMTADTQKTVEWFDQNLGFVPQKFCYPYNDTVHGVYTQILQQHGFQEFYGAERIDIERFRDAVWCESNRLWLNS